MEKTERRIRCIKHLGFHQDGLRPQTAIRMYKILVRPLLEYGAQVLTYKRHFLNSSRPPENINETMFFLKDLEDLQTKALKSLLQCPKNVSPSIVRLLAGVEPMACRIDILKLRYFWKITHAPSSIIPKSIVCYRKSRILCFNVGFTMDIFNLCCKIGNMSFWHGRHRENAYLQRNVNPLNTIKRAVTTYHLCKDFNTAKTKDCLFTKLYLSNCESYKDRYFLTKPFTSIGTFHNSSSRLKLIKVLLSRNKYLQSCSFCSMSFYNLLLHQIYACSYLKSMRETFRNKLLFYGCPFDPHPFQPNDFPKLLSYVLQDKNLLRAFTAFLEEIDY